VWWQGWQGYLFVEILQNLKEIILQGEDMLPDVFTREILPPDTASEAHTFFIEQATYAFC
jgi:hypothetical protein